MACVLPLRPPRPWRTVSVSQSGCSLLSALGAGLRALLNPVLQDADQSWHLIPVLLSRVDSVVGKLCFTSDILGFSERLVMGAEEERSGRICWCFLK